MAQADANASAFPNQATALHRAAFHGSQAVIDLLLEHRADPCRATISGGTPLHNASRQGHSAAFDLLAAAADPANVRPADGRHSECVGAAGPTCCAKCLNIWRSAGGGACGPVGHACANKLIFDFLRKAGPAP